MELICSIAVAVATVVGTIVAVKQLTKKEPTPELAGDITGVFVESTSPGSLRGQFELKGFKGRPCPVKASVYNAATNQPVAGFTDQVVLTLRPEAQSDKAASAMPIKFPTTPGAYYVVVVLSDPAGVELDRQPTAAVQIGPTSTTRATTTNPNAYPNALERTLVSHIPTRTPAVNERACSTWARRPAFSASRPAERAPSGTTSSPTWPDSAAPTTPRSPARG